MISFFRDVLRVLRLPCREQTHLLSRQLDAPLSRGEACGSRIHVLYCRSCRTFRKQIRLLRDLAGSAGRELQSAGELPEDVRRRIVKGIQANRGRDTTQES
ncbi:MAG: hypothetical protein SGJ09_04265 [Phycisphaerae bacterium]|nr:hypothetical protein [Phycisphaerae bacterium]